MSHVATIKAEIKSLNTLKKACKKLNLEFIENQKTYKWFGKHVGDYPIPEGFTINDMGRCEHAIKVPGAKYEIGVVKDPLNPKNYKLIWDFWDRNLPKILGKDAWKLTQRYELEQGKEAAKKKGWIPKEVVMEDRIRLEIEIPDYLG